MQDSVTLAKNGADDLDVRNHKRQNLNTNMELQYKTLVQITLNMQNKTM